MNLQEICLQVIEAAKEAGSFIKQNYGKVNKDAIETKSHNSLVSFVDQNAEALLVNSLSKIIPNCGFITEEDTVDDDSKSYVWIIDPLDGTTNFLHNIPHFSTSIGLSYEGELLLGVVYNIMSDECFYAWKNGGAFMNGQAIQLSTESHLSECIIATGFPYESYYDKKPYLDMLEIIMRDARGVRRFGSAALDMAYVACGRFSAFYETSLNPWDVAGGIVICREAGAIISDYHGKDSYLKGQSTLVANPTIHQKLLELTDKLFQNI